MEITKLDFLKTVYSLIGKCRARSGHPQVIQYRSWNLSHDRPGGQQYNLSHCFDTDNYIQLGNKLANASQD